MNFTSWCETVPEEITGDRVWRVKAYQLATHRLQLFSEIIRLLLTMIPDQRGASLRKSGPLYEIEAFDLHNDVPLPLPTN